MSSIGRSSRVHLVATAVNGKRCYLAQLGTKRNKRGELVLNAHFDDDPGQSQPMSYDFAVIVRRRMLTEHNVIVRFTLSAGDSADFISE
jgi:hypothetical protein